MTPGTEEKRDDCQRGRGWELSVHRGTSWCKESMLETYEARGVPYAVISL